MEAEALHQRLASVTTHPTALLACDRSQSFAQIRDEIGSGAGYVERLERVILRDNPKA